MLVLTVPVASRVVICYSPRYIWILCHHSNSLPLEKCSKASQSAASLVPYSSRKKHCNSIANFFSRVQVTDSTEGFHVHPWPLPKSHIEEAPQSLVGCKANAVLGDDFQCICCPAPIEALQAFLQCEYSPITNRCHLHIHDTPKAR